MEEGLRRPGMPSSVPPSVPLGGADSGKLKRITTIRLRASASILLLLSLGLPPGAFGSTAVYFYQGMEPSPSPEPSPGPSSCDTALDLSTQTSPLSSSTVGAPNTYRTSCGGSGNEKIFYVEVPAGGELTIGMTSNTYDSRHETRWGGSCPGDNSVACTDDPDTRQHSWTNTQGSAQTAFFIVDAYSSGSGDFVLAWNVPPLHPFPPLPPSPTPPPPYPPGEAPVPSPTSPPPLSPPSPPPPLPPLSPDFVAAASEAELRSLIEGASSDISVYLPPSAHLKLSSRISCTSNIKVTVASSGEGATLDGQERTGLFKLEYGCSLTLRGLTLVNGRGVVETYGAGDVEIIDSTVRDCSAADVRRVELAASLQRHTAAGREVKRDTAVRRVELAASSSAALQRGESWRGTRLASPRSLLATAVRRRRLGEAQRCGLDNRLERDRLLCWHCAPRRASRPPAAPHGSGAREGHGCLTPLCPRNRSTAASSTRLRTAVRSR